MPRINKTYFSYTNSETSRNQWTLSLCERETKTKRIVIEWQLCQKIGRNRRDFFILLSSNIVKLSEEHQFSETTQNILSFATKQFIGEGKKLKIHKIEIQYTPFSIETSSIIYLLPKVIIPSYLDNRYLLSEWNWAVTLIVTKGSTNCGLPQHAQLVIEGVKDSKFFFHIAHFNGSERQVKYNEDVDPKKLKFRQRSEVWKVSAEKVTNMIKSIQKDMEEPPRYFSKCGSESIFVSEGTHSCITWAREKLEVADIKLPPVPLEKIVTITTFYTNTDKEHKQLSVSATAYEL